MGRRILNEALRKMVNAERRGKATAPPPSSPPSSTS